MTSLDLELELDQLRPAISPPAARGGLARRVYLPRTADALAFSMATYAIPLLVLAITGAAALTGAAFALEWASRLATFCVAGAVADRYGATTVFRTAAETRAAVVVIAAVALAALPDGTSATVVVMLLATLTGILTEISYIAAETIGAAAGRAAGQQAHRVQSVLLGIDQGATLTGPALGGLLLHAAGAAGMLITIGALSLFAAALAPTTDGSRTGQRPVREGMRVGWRTLRSLPALGWLVGGCAVANLASGVLQAAAPVMVVTEFRRSSAAVGVVWSAAASAALLTVAVARWAIGRVGLWPVTAASATAGALASLVVARVHSYLPYLLLIAVLMAAESGTTVVLRTVRARLVPGEAFGSTLALTILLMLLPLPAAGLVVALTPPTALAPVITVCAALQALVWAAALTRLRRDPHLRRAAAQP